MKLSIVAGATSQSINVFIQDSSSTTGAGLTGLVFNTSSLAAYYSFTGTNATATSITLATLSLVTSAWSSGGFKEIDATHMAGWYRLDLPNAVLAASSGRVVSLHLYGATNMAPCPVEIELTGWNNQDAVHGGMSALPNTACTTNASLLTSGTGTDQISVSAGKMLLQATQSGVTIPTVTTVTNQLTAAAIATGVWQDATAGDFTTASSIGKSLYTSGVIPGASGGLFIAGTNAATTVTTAFTTTFTGNLTGSVASVTAAIALPGIPSNWITAAGITAGALNGKGDWSTYAGGDTSGTTTLLARLTTTRAGYLDNLSAGAVALASGVTVTTNSDKTGYSLTQSFPSNFASLSISVAGKINEVVLCDTTTTLTNLPSIPANWITATGITAAALNGKGDWSTSTSVWDQAVSGHTTSGTFGAAMNAAGSAGDPWATSLPGAYGAGTAGYILSHPDKTGYLLAAAGLDSVVVETGVNARQAMQIIGAEAAGKLVVDISGNYTFSAMANPGTTRIAATTNSTGRPTVTLTPS